MTQEELNTKGYFFQCKAGELAHKIVQMYALGRDCSEATRKLVQLKAITRILSSYNIGNEESNCLTEEDINSTIRHGMKLC
jgi:hypothetical protein